MADILKEAEQQHILDAIPADASEADKQRLFDQVKGLNSSYPGGLAQYVANARSLLQDSLEGKSPYENCKPTVPTGERLAPNTPQFEEMEKAGMAEVKDACFVIVAGGLGERLGYSGIKLELPSEVTTGKCFLELYCQHILALRDRARKETGDDTITIPLCIMTSGDTHEQTVSLLSKNNNFGMGDSITIVKQEKVPALVDQQAKFSMVDNFEIATKPHGHGDVHTLLHSQGVAAKWKGEGRKWVCFLQDTNGLVFHSIVPAIGVSASQSFAVNSLTVPRRPGEAVGGICGLEFDDGTSLTLNVEYNQLDPLLKASGKTGDTADETGFSPFPGNINVLVFELGSYVDTLARTNGSIPEFVNPKYSDETKTTFKKPTRLECMMQDYPKLLKGEKVGFTQIERWLSFSAVKNNVSDAVAKFKSTGVAESAASGEADMYLVNRKIMESVGVQVATEAETKEYCGVPVSSGARVVLAPSFATTIYETKSRFPTPSEVKISSRSTLVVEGDVVFESLDLDGAMVISAAPGARVVVKGLKVSNDGWEFVTCPGDAEEKYQIRGYVLEKKASAVYSFTDSGEHVLSA